MYILQELAAENPDDADVVTAFARGLANLSYDQEEENALKTLGVLQSLLTDNPDVTEVAVQFARGLCGLCYDPGPQAVNALAVLEKLAEEYPEEEDVVTEFAKGLVLLGPDVDERSAEGISARLERLIMENPHLYQVIAEFLEENQDDEDDEE